MQGYTFTPVRNVTGKKYQLFKNAEHERVMVCVWEHREHRTSPVTHASEDETRGAPLHTTRDRATPATQTTKKKRREKQSITRRVDRLSLICRSRKTRRVCKQTPACVTAARNELHRKENHPNRRRSATKCQGLVFLPPISETLRYDIAQGWYRYDTTESCVPSASRHKVVFPSSAALLTHTCKCSLPSRWRRCCCCCCTVPHGCFY